jgi:hypothetical protein
VLSKAQRIYKANEVGPLVLREGQRPVELRWLKGQADVDFWMVLFQLQIQVLCKYS